jgi:thymidylate synthase (FAD)
MKIIEPSHEILTINPKEPLKLLEIAGRTCYKSEDKITDDSNIEFCRKILARKHESVIEHASMTVRFICDRGVSHELVRHRLSSFSQQSTRYCNYSADKHDNQIKVIKPFFYDLNNESFKRFLMWQAACEFAEEQYLALLADGSSPQEARSVLPNSLATEIVVTANLREWRCIFLQRTASGAHPQMRQIMIPLLKEVQTKIPVIFDDIIVKG